MINFDAFSHGQIQSKMWLCKELEPYVPNKSSVYILGSWYNTLGFMMLVRNPDKYQFITGIDIDPEAKLVGDKLCEGWMMRNAVRLKNITHDVNTFNCQGYNVVINCSVEHIEGTNWFSQIGHGTLVCFQSSNITTPEYPWFIKTPSPTLDSFTEKFPLTTTYFRDTLKLEYENFSYDRHMIIGIK